MVGREARAGPGQALHRKLIGVGALCGYSASAWFDLDALLGRNLLARAARPEAPGT